MIRMLCTTLSASSFNDYLRVEDGTQGIANKLLGRKITRAFLSLLLLLFFAMKFIMCSDHENWDVCLSICLQYVCAYIIPKYCRDDIGFTKGCTILTWLSRILEVFLKKSVAAVKLESISSCPLLKCMQILFLSRSKPRIERGHVLSIYCHFFSLKIYWVSRSK